VLPPSTGVAPTDATAGPDDLTYTSPYDAVGNVTAVFLPGRNIGNRYVIVRLLGVGGMGAVYQAFDEKLGVPIALKTIRRPAGSDAPPTDTQERRFKRELLLARRVTHKNVVRIHDLGEVDGMLYITMPYVPGNNLAAVLAREGRLPVARVLQIAREVAAGLAAAHEAGVVHRDLKPANIMIEDDGERALIMDFGIARSTSVPAAASHTEAFVGTLAYMSPEQAEGKVVDHRSDQYAFGLVLYDLLSGGRPAAGSGVADLIARMRNSLPPLRSLNPAVPEPLEQIIDRCLERDPNARYATTAELVQALNSLDSHGVRLPPPGSRRSKMLMAMNGIGIFLALAAVGWSIRSMRAGARPEPVHEPVSVLIADFENRVNDPVFDGSIEQALTIGVEGAAFIAAYPRSQAHHLAGQLIAGGRLDDKAAQLISVRDGVKFVVGGSIDGGNGGYQITANLIDPAVGKTLKTMTASARTKAEVLQAVGSLAADMRREMGDRTSESARLAASETFTTTSLAAVREYTIAQDLQNSSKDEEAIPHFKRAIELDPQFGRAYSGWAVCSFQLGQDDQANDLWKKALSLMDRMTDRERYRTLGTYYLAVARNYDQAIDTYVKLLDRYPADRSAHNNLAYAYFNKLNFPKALEEGRKALDIYKGSVKFRNNYVLYAMYAGDFETAEKGARALLREDPTFADAYYPLATSLLAKGDRAGARAAYDQMARTGASGASRAAMGLADLAMYEGRFSEAERILSDGELKDQRSGNTVGRATKAVALAEAYLALGKRPQALDAVRRALSVTHLEYAATGSARVLTAAGKAADASALAAELSRDLQPQTRAYADIMTGETALFENRVNDSVEAFRKASSLLDVWLSHFDLGVAYVEAGHYAEALSEFETCQKRRGEAVALFLDDVPSFRYLAALPYWLARAQEGVGMKGPSAENFKAYLAIRSGSDDDPLAADARRRLVTK
jgi:tetratricopeptide (TPR) repeat protein/tRNA A-37 threonylcarbamoyl transferase component Bud32